MKDIRIYRYIRSLILFTIVIGMVYRYIPLHTSQIKKLLTTQFGKTHFIVGFPHQPYRSTKSNIPQSSYHPSVLFAPSPEVLSRLVDLIAHEQTSISIATFLFTDKHIAQALIDAHRRGVHIEIIIDRTGIQDRFNKIGGLTKENIPVYVYHPGDNKQFFVSRMHNKFIIFEKNCDNKSYVWTGSCNLTRSSYTRNQENVIILEDPEIVRAFTVAFQSILEKSIPIERYHRASFS